MISFLLLYCCIYWVVSYSATIDQHGWCVNEREINTPHAQWCTLPVALEERSRNDDVINIIGTTLCTKNPTSDGSVE